ncbi:MAG: transposase [Armatimonadia bacterium]
MPSRDDHYVTEFSRTQRHLPHHEGIGETYFVCICLRRPPVVDLTEPHVAQMLIDSLLYFDVSRYVLFDYVVMPDHVHMIIEPVVCDGRAERITHVMRSLKSWTAKRINEMKGRRGHVWQEDAYDHIIRNGEDYLEKSTYIFNNPMVAGLVRNPADWPWWGRGSGRIR